MTVVLHFKGGPYDGGHKRVSSADLTPGKLILAIARKHLYVSNGPWSGIEDHVALDCDERVEDPMTYPDTVIRVR